MIRSNIFFILLVISSVLYAGDTYIPKRLEIIVPQSVEIYTLNINCWVTDYEPITKSLDIYIRYSSDLAMQTGGPCDRHFLEPFGTSCEQDLANLEQVLTEYQNCDYQKNIHDFGGGIDLTCRSTRLDVVDLIHEMCRAMNEVE